MITLPNGRQLTPDSVERALDQHQAAGLIARWHNWHEERPGRKRPMYTVTLRTRPSHTPGVIDLATLHEAHAFLAGLMSASDALAKAAEPDPWISPVPGPDGRPSEITDL